MLLRATTAPAHRIPRGLLAVLGLLLAVALLALPQQGSGAAAAAKTVYPIKLEAKGTVDSIAITVTVKKAKKKLPAKAKARMQYLDGKRWKTVTTRRLVKRKAVLTWRDATPTVTYRLRVQILKGRKVIETSKALLSRRTKKRFVPGTPAPASTPTPAATATPAPAAPTATPTPTPTPTPEPEPPAPLALLTLQTDASVAVGLAHSCAITTTQSVRCWGTNADGQLGLGDTAPRASATTVPGLPAIVAIAAGDAATCALSASREVWCWGDTEPTNGTDPDNAPDASSPVNLSAGLGPMNRIAASAYEFCGLTSAGVVCWLTYGGNGALGTVTLSEGAGAVDLAATPARTCGKFGAASYRCWGRGAATNADLALKDAHGITAADAASFIATIDPPCAPPSTGPHTTCGSGPIADQQGWFDVFGGALAITGPGGSRRCAITPEQTVFCLEDPTAPTTGPGTGYRPAGPSAVPNLTDVVSVAVGLTHACAILESAEVKCWGSNAGNQLGRSTLGAPGTDTPQLVVNG